MLVNPASDTSTLEAIRSLLAAKRSSRYEITELDLSDQGNATDQTRLRRAVEHDHPDLMLLCLPDAHPDHTAKAVLTQAREQRWPQPVVVVAKFTEANAIIELLKLGAADFVTLPLNPTEIIPRLWGLTGPTGPAGLATPNLRATPGFDHIVGRNSAFVRIVQQIPRIARNNATVLITGETGTGKDLLARAVHRLGPRSAKPFVAVNCGAIPADLIENELFGHEPGAYTSAETSRRGVLKEADRGTLFLDEIDTLPALAQVKLLRFLQDGEFRPLGSERPGSSDVRVIAASNADLAASVQRGQFRRDLYYRLNVIRLSLPALRNRLEDTPCWPSTSPSSTRGSSTRTLDPLRNDHRRGTELPENEPAS